MGCFYFLIYIYLYELAISLDFINNRVYVSVHYL